MQTAGSLLQTVKDTQLRFALLLNNYCGLVKILLGWWTVVEMHSAER